jgi:hypothetical protein
MLNGAFIKIFPEKTQITKIKISQGKMGSFENLSANSIIFYKILGESCKAFDLIKR